MSLKDFDACTPTEFEAIAHNYQRYHIQEPWERSRFGACASLQPYSKTALKVTDVCMFSWDKKPSTKKHEASTRERFEELIKKTNNTTHG